MILILGFKDCATSFASFPSSLPGRILKAVGSVPPHPNNRKTSMDARASGDEFTVLDLEHRINSSLTGPHLKVWLGGNLSV